MRCKNYFGARKFVTNFLLRGDPEELSDKLPRGMGVMGGAQAIMVDPVKGTLLGGSDPRLDGLALDLET